MPVLYPFKELLMCAFPPPTLMPLLYSLPNVDCVPFSCMSHWTHWCLCFISPLLLRNINMLLACVHITSTPLLYVSKCKNFISSTLWPFYSSITFFRHTSQRRLHLLFCLFLLCILILFKTKDSPSWLQNTLSQRVIIALLLSQVRFLHIVPPCNLFFSHEYSTTKPSPGQFNQFLNRSIPHSDEQFQTGHSITDLHTVLFHSFCTLQLESFQAGYKRLKLLFLHQ